MNASTLRRFLYLYVVLLAPLAWIAARYDPYGVDGDAVAYMDLADLIHAGKWHEAVNGYWHPLYPAFLAAAQSIFHSSRWNELGAYYSINVLIFFLEVASVVLLTHGMARLRHRLAPGLESLFTGNGLCLVGLSLLLITTMRDMTLGKVRTDSLLQALIFLGIGLLLESLAAEGAAAFLCAALMGLTFGLAYLTKSFAFLLALLSIGTLVAFAVLACRRRLGTAMAQGALALLCFAVVGGPYIAALSHQQGRFDFGDSGNLNYVWYVSGTEKFHLEPRMTSSFGSAHVELRHPEQELMQSPGVYSYATMQNGTYPPWFSPTYWNDHITPKFNLRLLARRDARNVVLIVRYLINHPEPLILLLVLLVTCATLRGPSNFAWPAILLGVLVWGIYALVNVEERYVTAAFLLILLGLFACLRPSEKQYAQPVGLALLLLFACLPLGTTLREAAEARRQQSLRGMVPAWRDAQIFGAAEGLRQMGIQSPDRVACVGMEACVHDHYWARLAGVRIIAELYEPVSDNLMQQLDTMPNRERAYQLLRSQGAQVLVGNFDPAEMNAGNAAAAGWQRLGDTRFYARRLNGTP